MPGERPFKLRSMTDPSPCPAMILPREVHEKAADSMNFVNFAGKRQGFQEPGLVSIGLRRLPPDGSAALPGPPPGPS